MLKTTAAGLMFAVFVPAQEVQPFKFEYECHAQTNRCTVRLDQLMQLMDSNANASEAAMKCKARSTT